MQYITIVVASTKWYWNKNRHMDQWNKIGIPDIYPYISN